MMIAKLNRIVFVLIVLCFGLLLEAPVFAQVRALYTPGMNATNSGLLPAPGITYVNYFQYYSFDKLKGPQGGTITDNLDFGLFIDQNIFLYVTKYKLLGATLAFLVDLPFANASLTVADRPLGSSTGFAESFYQPLLLGWQKDRYGIQAGYAFFADTGKAGSGYWGNALTLGDTFYLTKNKAICFSSYQIYEFHTEKDDSRVTPGQAFSLDYSLMMTLPIQKEMKSLLQFGLIGYGQWQVSDNSGSDTDPVLRNIHYKVNAIGFGLNLILPPQGVSLGLKYFHEYGAEATVEGQSLQISAAVTF
jgi:hypothetical protein